MTNTKADRILLILLPIIALFSITILIYYNKINYLLLGTFIIIPFIFGSIIYILLKTNKSQVYHNNPYKKIHKYLFSLLYLISIIILLYVKIRNYQYYFIISILFIICFIDIIYNINNKIILIKLILLYINISLGINLKYDYFIGRTDPFFHIQLVESIINNYKLTDIMLEYSKYPLWHINMSSIILITNYINDSHKLIYLLNSCINIILILFFYLLSKKIFKINPILPTFMLVINPYFIYTGISALPRFTNNIFFIILIYFYYKSKNILNKQDFILTNLLIISSILYHSITILIHTLFLTLIYAFYKISKTTNYIKLSYIIYIIIIYFAYNTNYSINMIAILIKLIINSPIPSIISVGNIDPIRESFNYLQFTGFLLLLIIGHFSIKNNKLKMLSYFTLIVSIVAFPTPLLLIDKLSNNFYIERMAEYTYPFISLISGIGLIHLTNRVRNKKILFMIIFVTIFLSISNDFVASDNPIIKREFYTFYLTKNEIKGGNFCINNIKQLFLSDRIIIKYYHGYNHINNSYLIEYNINTHKIVTNSIEDVIYIRLSELNKRPLSIYPIDKNTFIKNVSWNQYSRYVYKDSQIWTIGHSENTIYNNKNNIAITKIR